MTISDTGEAVQMHDLIRETARDVAGDHDRAYWREHAAANEFPQEY